MSTIGASQYRDQGTIEPAAVDNSSHSDQDVEKQESQPVPEKEQSSAFKALGWLDRLLALWILIAMIVGVLLGNFVPSTGPALQKGKFVGVSIPIAIGLLIMMYPILCKVKYETLHQAFRSKQLWIQIGFSILLNWIVAPFLMLALAWAFLPDEPGLREGLILVGLARCIAMVLIWTEIAGGDNQYCAILVAVNSVLQIVLYAPMAIFFINIISHSQSEITVSYSTVAISVAVFLGIPLGAAIVTRFAVTWVTSPEWYQRVFLRYISPWSLIGLLYTILVLFASQGRQVVHQIVSVVRVAAPLIVYFVAIFSVTLLVSHRLGFGYKLSATQSFTAASNNFELAIAVAVATYGPDSDQALASTVGPLVEVPVLLGLTRDLSRVRQNQQRSRERKRAYVAELEAKIAHLLSHDNFDQTTYATRVTHSAAAYSDASHNNDEGSVTLTPSVGLSNRAGTVTTTPSLMSGAPHEAIFSSLPVSTPSLGTITIENFPQAISRPAQPEHEALFKDPRSLGLLEPLPLLSTVESYPRNLSLAFDDFGTDGTTACPIAFSLILQNNVRDYSFARLESKLLAGYQTPGSQGDGCRIHNKVLFAVLAEIS
ncbi:hypothetical protein Q7P35_003365 [Cladosporium inversicolor]